MKIVTAEQMRQIDRACIEQGTPTRVLMENAGKAVAKAMLDYFISIDGLTIVSLAGGGNNGGDALVAARYLADWGSDVTVYLCSQRDETDENLQILRKMGVTCINSYDSGPGPVREQLAGADCVIDGLLGTGRMRPLEGLFRDIMEAVKTERAERGLSVVAVDLPTGMDADIGDCDPACCPADLTVTLACPKPGLFGFPGADYTGKLIIADIGIPAELADSSTVDLMDDDLARHLLPERRRTANKGTFGKLLVMAGSINYTGAAILACRGALRTGTGLVTLATAASLHPVIAGGTPEMTHLPLPESPAGYIGAQALEVIHSHDTEYTAILAGCGLGRNPATAEFVRALLSHPSAVPLILDADGLNIMADIPDWNTILQPGSILTPHPGEMSRLSKLSVSGIQADRLSVTRDHAIAWQQTVVLKGAYTIIAAPDGRCRISPFANPGLASGGTGDVLAGIIGGLTAQGLAPFDAASLGVYLHGAAGERVRENTGETGMLAGDLPRELPATIRDLKKKPENRER